MGKSTAAVNLAYSLAKNGSRVLLADCDFDMRCLDLLLGAEDRVLYDLLDAAKGRVSVEKAMLRDERSENLYFLAAPSADGRSLTGGELARVFEEARQAEPFDFILLDTPGSLGAPALLEAGIADEAMIVASHHPASIRAACQTGEMLEEAAVPELRLLINQFDLEGAASGRRPGVNEIIDRSYIRLCGIVPYDSALMLASENGKLAFELKHSPAAAAFDNIARRLNGQNVPLFDGFTGWRTKRLIRRLLEAD